MNQSDYNQLRETAWKRKLTTQQETEIKTYLANNPEAAQMSVNQLLSVLSDQGVRAGRTTVSEALKEAKGKAK